MNQEANNGKEPPLGMMSIGTSLFLIVTGLLGVGIYAAGAARILLNDLEDRSWLLWGLGLVAIGITLIVGGVLLFLYWRRMEADTAED